MKQTDPHSIAQVAYWLDVRASVLQRILRQLAPLVEEDIQLVCLSVQIVATATGNRHIAQSRGPADGEIRLLIPKEQVAPIQQMLVALNDPQETVEIRLSIPGLASVASRGQPRIEWHQQDVFTAPEDLMPASRRDRKHRDDSFILLACDDAAAMKYLAGAHSRIDRADKSRGNEVSKATDKAVRELKRKGLTRAQARPLIRGRVPKHLRDRVFTQTIKRALAKNYPATA